MNIQIIVDSVRSFFERRDIGYEYDEVNKEFTFGFYLDDCSIAEIDFSLFFNGKELEEGICDSFSLIGFTPMVVNDRTRQELDNLISWINDNDSDGHWMISQYDKLVYTSKTALNGDSIALPESMIESRIYDTKHTIENLLDPILAVVIGAWTSDEAKSRFHIE